MTFQRQVTVRINDVYNLVTNKILKICNMLKNKCVTVTENFIFRKAILQYLKLLRLKSLRNHNPQWHQERSLRLSASDF
jgi:hypothetical protein